MIRAQDGHPRVDEFEAFDGRSVAKLVDVVGLAGKSGGIDAEEVVCEEFSIGVRIADLECVPDPRFESNKVVERERWHGAKCCRLELTRSDGHGVSADQPVRAVAVVTPSVVDGQAAGLC